jgi:glycosyltransferase involved in cell wall biosynthesis
MTALRNDASGRQDAPTIKVVHIINSLPSLGGAERLVLDLATRATHRPVPVITWWDADNSLLRQDDSSALDLIALRPFRLANLRRAVRVVRDSQVVHFHLFPSQYLIHLFRKPSLFTEHNTWNRRREYKLLRPLERHCYRRFSKVIAISDAVGHSLCDWLRETPPRLETIENGIALDRFSRRLRTCPTAEVKIGMAARMCDQKDHDTLIKALALLPARYRLRLAGDGPLRPAIERLAAQLGVSARVEFVGVVTDMPAFYESLDIYVQSTHWDGFSLVVVEAMGSGLPTLASDVVGVRDVVANSQALFPLGDAPRLAERIATIAENPDIYGQMSASALARAHRFDIQRTAQEYQRAYEEVATQR